MKSSKLRALKSKKNYKSLNTFLNSVYNQHRSAIDNGLLDIQLNKKIKTKRDFFKTKIKQLMSDESLHLKNINQALDYYSRTQYMMPGATQREKINNVYANNFLSGIRKDKDVSKQIRNMIRDEKGRFQKMDASKIEYSRAESKKGKISVFYYKLDANHKIRIVEVEYDPKNPGSGPKYEISGIIEF